MQNLVKGYIRKYRYLSFSSRKLPPFIDIQRNNEYSKILYENGVTVIPSQVVMSNIKNFEKTLNKILDLDLEKIKIEYFKTYKGEKNYKLSLIDYLNKKEVNELFNSTFILNIIKEYFNCEPDLVYSDLWLDIPTLDNEKQTQLFHRDYDNKFLVKVFIYLNDVGIDNGPFCYIKKSHKNPWILYNGKNRLNDKEVNSLYKENNNFIITGEKFTMILADTNGFHKGLKPKHQRLLLTGMFIKN